MNRLLTFVLILTLSCAHKAPERVFFSPEDRKLLSGTWYGEGINHFQNNYPYQWLIDRRENGTYTITFRTKFPDGKREVSKFEGVWGIYDNIYFTSARKEIIGDKSVDIYPFDYAYEIISFNEKEFVFVNRPFKSELRVKKVPPSFQMPEN